jgi:hypothetical protein
MNQNNDLAKFIAQAINEYLRLAKNQNIKGDEIYKFSTKLWFDTQENGLINSISIRDVKLTALNKTLNKKYRNESLKANG